VTYNPYNPPYGWYMQYASNSSAHGVMYVNDQFNWDTREPEYPDVIAGTPLRSPHRPLRLQPDGHTGLAGDVLIT
jgi:hypothetical protein